MELTPRQVSFIRLMLEEREYRPLGHYARTLGVTDRTLRDDLKEIDGFLSGLGLELDRRAGRGILLGPAARESEDLARSLAGGGREEGYLTPEGRRLEILRELLSHSEQYLSIQRLSRRYFVSRTSIVNDLRYVEDWLSAHGLALARTVSGTRVSGGEAAIRKAFAALIEEGKTGEGEGERSREAPRIDSVTMAGLLKLFRREDILFLAGLLDRLEERCGCAIGEPYYLNLTTHLLICVERVAKGQRVEEPAEEMSIDLRRMPAYEHAAAMGGEIEAHFGIKLGEAEIYYIYQYLVSFGVGAVPGAAQERRLGEEDPAQALAAGLTDWVSQAMGVDLNLNEKLEKELLLHVRSMMNRVKYDIQVRNNLLPEVRRLYPELLAYLEGAVWALGGRCGLGDVSADETAYLAMYFQVALERLVDRPSILVVCQSGYGTSQLLKTRIAKAFPAWEVAGVVSARELAGMDLGGYGLVASTVALPELSVPHVVISALLSERDIGKLRSSGAFSRGAEDWRRVAEGWDGRNLLRITEDPAIWADWERAAGESPGRKRLRGGRLDVTLCLESPEDALDVLIRADGPAALLRARASEGVRTLLSGYYRLLRSGCDWAALERRLAPAGLLRELLPPEHILTGLDAADKESAIRALADCLQARGRVRDAAAFAADVQAREAEGCTAIGEGVALPHGKSDTAVGLSLALGVLREPIPWDEDGEVLYAQVLVLFAVGDEPNRGRDQRYVTALQAVCAALDDPGRVEAILSAEDGEAVIEILTRDQAGQ